MFDPDAKWNKFDFKHMGRSYDSRLKKTAQSYGSWNTMGDYGSETSGVSTPPLWGNNPSKSVDYRCLLPSSKAEAIARGQRELMDMVSRMPESCFELTLKDLVEYRDAADVEPKQESCAGGKGAINEDTYSKDKEKNQKNQKPQIKTSGSVDNHNGGFLLKMVFPFSLGSKSKKKKMKRNGSNVNYNSRVSPKPSVSYESGKSIAIDKEWWKKRSGSSESDGGGSNVNSRSTKSIRSSNTIGRHTVNGCLSFIFNWKRKASPAGLV